jgi:hypothetical protein
VYPMGFPFSLTSILDLSLAFPPTQLQLPTNVWKISLRSYAQDIAHLAASLHSGLYCTQETAPCCCSQHLPTNTEGYRLRIPSKYPKNHVGSFNVHLLITPQELANNQSKLATASWNPDAPIKDIWRHVPTTQVVL